ncbi:GTP 3',8-cyclase MoaA [Terriglobus albidus]|uniref:GTP 3',8-cyclase MoaA n=1 Tax=Terriglobus albidus TaxID=1592106 RepID=UPI0037DA39DE
MSFPSMTVVEEQMPTGNTPMGSTVRLRDKFNRAITDLRLSITDRCNFRCVYCRSGQGATPVHELPMADYARIARVFLGMGIEKIRLTGGEPLLRHDLLDLVAELAGMRTLDGERPDIALTTNGHRLAELAEPLRRAGLSRITVSMDAVDPETFARITRVPRSYERVLDGIRAAKGAGLAPVKVNCVLMRGWNDDQIERFAEFARSEDVIVRFIEFMPLEEDKVWSRDLVIPLEEIVGRLQRVGDLRELAPNSASETARRYGFSDGRGEIGIIAPVSHPFCGHCSRVRLTSDGKIRTCLFSQLDHDLHAIMRRGGTDEEMSSYIRQIVDRKEERHHIGDTGFIKPARAMVQIGG